MQSLRGQFSGVVAHTSSSGAEFHRFFLFPAEIRLMIWEAATRETRQVILRAPPQTPEARELRDRMGHSHRVDVTIAAGGQPSTHFLRPSRTIERQSLGHDVGWSSPTPPPAMLGTCREARAVALGAYRPAFGWLGLPGRVWINFAWDEVVVWARDCVGSDAWDAAFAAGTYRAAQEAWLTTGDVARIQRMTVHHGRSWYAPNFAVLAEMMIPGRGLRVSPLNTSPYLARAAYLMDLVKLTEIETAEDGRVHRPRATLFGWARRAQIEELKRRRREKECCGCCLG